MVGREAAYSNKGVIGLTPLSRTSDGSGDTIDTQNYEAATVYFQIGTVLGTISLTPELLESDSTGTGFTVVASADLMGSFTEVTSSAGNNTVQKVGYKGTKRYLRVNDNRTGTSAVVTSAMVVLSNPRHAPVYDTVSSLLV